MKNHLDELYKYSAKELTAYRPEAKIAYSELIGLDLAISPYNAPPMPGQQDILNEAIIAANVNIVKLNVSNGVPTPWIAKKVHVPRKNGYHHHYTRLWDGIHWNEALMKECADRFVETILRMR